ncbi:MAG: TatD family hydrolase [Bacteroidaceae bacterium]|nr:TatD family hydrolase [Bacteroidaceae bacterium]
MIDTHSHLDGPEFQEDLGEVIQRAKEAGVEKIFVPAICRKDLSYMVQTCNAYPDYLYPMIGLHPENIMDEDYHVALDLLEERLQESLNPTPSPGTPTFIAIGEVGLDFYWDTTHKAEQKEVFERQIQWAVKYQLPLMIHSRNAHPELMALMEKYRGEQLSGVFHCFTGTAEEARDLLSFPNFCLGIGGVLTFKKSALPAVVSQAVPLERIVLETDSPYMAPTPHRGKRNESAYIIEVEKKLAELFNTTTEDIDKKTTQNALKIFRKVQKE